MCSHSTQSSLLRWAPGGIISTLQMRTRNQKTNPRESTQLLAVSSTPTLPSPLIISLHQALVWNVAIAVVRIGQCRILTQFTQSPPHSITQPGADEKDKSPPYSVTTSVSQAYLGVCGWSLGLKYMVGSVNNTHFLCSLLVAFRLSNLF